MKKKLIASMATAALISSIAAPMEMPKVVSEPQIRLFAEHADNRAGRRQAAKATRRRKGTRR